MVEGGAEAWQIIAKEALSHSQWDKRLSSPRKALSHSQWDKRLPVPVTVLVPVAAAVAGDAPVGDSGGRQRWGCDGASEAEGGGSRFDGASEAAGGGSRFGFLDMLWGIGTRLTKLQSGAARGRRRTNCVT